MRDDNGEFGKEIERNKMSCFKFWCTAETGFALGEEKRIKVKNGPRGVADPVNILPDDVQITLPYGFVIHN